MVGGWLIVLKAFKEYKDGEKYYIIIGFWKKINNWQFRLRRVISDARATLTGNALNYRDDTSFYEHLKTISAKLIGICRYCRPRIT